MYMTKLSLCIQERWVPFSLKCRLKKLPPVRPVMEKKILSDWSLVLSLVPENVFFFFFPLRLVRWCQHRFWTSAPARSWHQSVLGDECRLHLIQVCHVIFSWFRGKSIMFSYVLEFWNCLQLALGCKHCLGSALRRSCYFWSCVMELSTNGCGIFKSPQLLVNLQTVVGGSRVCSWLLIALVILSWPWEDCLILCWFYYVQVIHH